MPAPCSKLEVPFETFHGVNITASPDQLRPGQVVACQNVVMNNVGELTTRPGATLVGPLTGVGSPVHSIFVLTDAVTTYPVTTTLYVLGIASSIYGWSSGPSWTLLASGFSGNPLTGVIYRLSGTGQPWLIIGDSKKMVKINSAGQVFQLGVTPDPDPSTAQVLSNANYVISYPTPADGSITVTGTSSTGADSASLSSLSRTSGRVAAVSGSPNDYVNNLPVTISAPSSPGFVGQFPIFNITTSTRFLYYQAGADASATGTLTANVGYVGTATSGTAVVFRKPQSLNLTTINGNISPVTDTIQAWVYLDDITKVSDVQIFFDLDSGSTGALKTNWTWCSVYSQLANGWNLVKVAKSSFTTVLNGGAISRPANNGDFTTIFGWDLYFFTTPSNTPKCGVAELFMQVAFGPNTSVGVGYDYRDTFYNPVTQSESNPSPVMAIDVYPVNQQVGLVPGSVSTDPQVTIIRWWRRGGTLSSAWYLVGSQKNLPIQTVTAIAMNPAGTIATYTTAGTNNFAAGDVIYSGGDANDVFNGWFTILATPGSNQFTVSNTSAGSSTTSAGGGTVQEAFIDIVPDASIVLAPVLSLQNDVPVTTINESGTIVYGQPLPYIWGPFNGTTIFGDGDPNQPGNLYWSNPTNPDAWGSLNFLEVTQPSDPLTLGCYWQGNVYARSMEFQGQIVPSQLAGFFSFNDVGSGESVATPWALLGGSGIPFMPWVGKSGIFIGTGGVGESLTDDLLWPLFDPKSTRPDAINWTLPQYNRLAWYDHHLFWSYMGMDGVLRCYRFDNKRGYWDGPHTWAFGVSTLYLQPEVQDKLLLGGNGGNLYFYDTSNSTDNGTAIAPLVETGAYKPDGFLNDSEWVDISVDAASPPGGVSVLASFGSTLAAYVPIGTCVSTTRATTSMSMQDTYSCGMSLRFTWSGSGSIYGFSALHRDDGIGVTHYQTPSTSFGASGYGHAYRALVCLRSTGVVNLTATVNDVTLPVQAISSTGNKRKRMEVFLPLNKGYLCKIALDAAVANQGFKIYPEDSSLEWMPWSGINAIETPLPFTGGFTGG
jgi:hypothetical protein